MAQNAITRRVEQLRRTWIKFVNSRNARILEWLIKENEYDLIDAFYETECDESGETEDIFLKFESPYEKEDEKYISNLTVELSNYIESAEEVFKQADISLDKWTPILNIEDRPNAIQFIKKLEEFREKLNIQGCLVAYFVPSKMTSPKNWEMLLEECAKVMPERIRFMIYDWSNKPIYDSLEKRIGDQLQIHEPELKMEDAVVELASKGGTNTPQGQFRIVYAELMQAATNNDLSLVKELYGKALRLTKKFNWPLMEATIEMAVGGVYISNKKFEDCTGCYNRAIDLLVEEIEEGNELAGQQIVMAYLSKGMALFVKKKYKEGAHCYQLAAEQSEKEQNDFLTMESWRMTGTSHQKSRANEDAEKAFKKAYEFGQKLDKDTRVNSTFPYVAKALMELTGHTERSEIDKEMTELAGEEWMNLANNKKIVKQSVV